MVRNYKKKTNRSDLDEKQLKVAIKDVFSKKYNISESARTHGFSRTTLRDRIKKINDKKIEALDDSGQSSDEEIMYSSKYCSNQVLTKVQEQDLSEYFKKCSNLQHGFTYALARKFVFDYTVLNDITMPPSWITNQAAGVDWLQGFMKRNKDLSLRKPENTSLARLTSFTKAAVMEFYDNVRDMCQKISFSPANIYNLDETGITTVLPSPKVSLYFIQL